MVALNFTTTKGLSDGEQFFKNGAKCLLQVVYSHTHLRFPEKLNIMQREIEIVYLTWHPKFVWRGAASLMLAPNPKRRLANKTSIDVAVL